MIHEHLIEIILIEGDLNILQYKPILNYLKQMKWKQNTFRFSIKSVETVFSVAPLMKNSNPAHGCVHITCMSWQMNNNQSTHKFFYNIHSKYSCILIGMYVVNYSNVGVGIKMENVECHRCAIPIFSIQSVPTKTSLFQPFHIKSRTK